MPQADLLTQFATILAALTGLVAAVGVVVNAMRTKDLATTTLGNDVRHDQKLDAVTLTATKTEVLVNSQRAELKAEIEALKARLDAAQLAVKVSTETATQLALQTAKDMAAHIALQVATQLPGQPISFQIPPLLPASLPEEPPHAA